MLKRDLDKVFDTQERAFEEKQFRSLCENYEKAQRRFKSILQQLPEQQQAVIGDYLYISEKVHYYLMALACEG